MVYNDTARKKVVFYLTCTKPFLKGDQGKRQILSNPSASISVPGIYPFSPYLGAYLTKTQLSSLSLIGVQSFYNSSAQSVKGCARDSSSLSRKECPGGRELRHTFSADD